MNIHIPTYEELYEKVAKKEQLNQLEQYLWDYEPRSNEHAEVFRADLHSLIEYLLRKEDK